MQPSLGGDGAMLLGALATQVPLTLGVLVFATLVALIAVILRMARRRPPPV